MRKMKQIRCIRCIIFDVDGTLTDGKIHISEEGELYKNFHVQDGYAIKYLLSKSGIEAAIITGRKSKIVEIRARELGIRYVFQGVSEKLEVMYILQKELKLKLHEVAFMGDDLNDLPAMQVAGISACPANAVPEVQKICTYVCKKSGGEGAAREFIDWLLESMIY